MELDETQDAVMKVLDRNTSAHGLYPIQLTRKIENLCDSVSCLPWLSQVVVGFSQSSLPRGALDVSASQIKIIPSQTRTIRLIKKNHSHIFRRHHEATNNNNSSDDE